MTRLFWLLLAMGLTGCQTIGYYKQAIQGQYQVLRHRQPMNELIAAPQTPATLKEKLKLLLRLRGFAEADLKLPVNGHYLRYADIHRDYVVWNVYAAPEFSLEPKTWWYPVVGSLEYRGYFSERDARRHAEKLAGKGFDTYVDGVEAYSTLGWFKDPILNTFIHHSEPELADIIFHELAHQRLFVRGDTDFNEAFATAVAQEGVRRWLLASGDSEALEEYQIALKRHKQFVQLIQTTRLELESIYCDEKPHTPINTLASVSDKRQQKEIAIGRLQREYEQLKSRWNGYSGYDDWFAQRVNNSQLNTVATYYELVPAFQNLLQQNAGDLEKFYREAQIVSKLPKEERHRKLIARETNP